MHFLCFNDHPQLTMLPSGFSRFLDYAAMMEVLQRNRKALSPLYYTLLNQINDQPRQVVMLLVFSAQPITGRTETLLQAAHNWLVQPSEFAR